MKYQFKIRFNTQHKDTNGLYWRVIINEKEYLFADVLIKNKEVKTISHLLASGEQKWSIYCDSDEYSIDEDKKMMIIY